MGPGKKLHLFAHSVLLKWDVHAVIVLIFLHPRIGRRNLELTYLLTGVKERTLSGWLCQKKMIQIWVDLVKDMTAEVALKSSPSHVQDLYMDIDLESQVSAYRYRQHIQRLQQNKLQVLYKGRKVSYLSKVYFLSPQTYHLHFFLFFSRLN
jgi:hypothetical protein